MAMPKRRNVVTSQTQVVSMMTTRLIISWYLQTTYVIYVSFFLWIQNLVTIFVILCE